MGLAKYRQKRSFQDTPEPEGGKPSGTELKFVIQKHAASHLHYDFRLEMEGVLKSWAVPKGPSTDPDVKRLAMMVEDHPFDYRNFEGIIPPGNYGAGTVIIWDEGTYDISPDPSKTKKQAEKELLRQLYSGKIRFRMNGKKLKGDFALVKAPARGENAWLLMKLQDKHASAVDILEKDKSVVSNKTLEQVANTTKNIWQSNRQAKEKKAEPANTKKDKKDDRGDKEVDAELGKLLKKAQKTKVQNYRPMLATLTDEPFDLPGWIYEVKWDGYRTLAFSGKNSAELKSRNDKSFNEKFYPVYDAVLAWNEEAVVDGEIVVLNEDGKSDFNALQNWRSEADGELIFYVFDILWYRGYDLTGLTLLERRKILSRIIPENGIIRLSEQFETSGKEFYQLAARMQLEGIMAKKTDSSYFPGTRTRDWLKVKVNQRHEVVIGGYTLNEGTGKHFSSILVGVYEGGKLIYSGKVGTGFNQKTQKEMLRLFEPLVTDKPPFSYTPDVNSPSRFRPNPPRASVTWLKPKLVCEVSYTELTSEGIMRHPSFQGMRTDKDAKDVHRDEVVKPEEVTKKKSRTTSVSGKKVISPVEEKSRKTLLNPSEETQVKKLNGHELRFQNLSKVFWPAEGYTKRDLLNYYYQVAPSILPYLKDRPQSLNRHPNGINGKSFYQKDVTGKVPDWVEKYGYRSEDEDRDKNFMVCSNEASLLLMASLGCIELNPWSSRVSKPDHPDWCIIDLDPDKNSFNQVIEAAQVTREILESMGVESYCKTSGSSGIHIYIPFGAKYTYEQSKEFARIVATLVQRELPDYTTIERAVANRGGKMYIDFLQNRPQATIAAPYSARPKPGAPVSMPLYWDEVKKGLKITDFTIKNAMARLKETGDIFQPVLGKGIDLQKVIKKWSGE